MFSDPTTPALTVAVAEFYRHGMRELNKHNLPFLVGGAYSFAQYTGIQRHTKDFDIFVRRSDCARAMEILENAGYKTELTFPHWLAKAYHRSEYIDIIFSSGNAICEVDEQWFENAKDGTVLGAPVKLVPPEEMIWPKLFIMERERFDGGDVVHLLKSCAQALDWQRLLARVGQNSRVLLAHLILFGYIYPGERAIIPEWVMQRLIGQVLSELTNNSGADQQLCQGTILSRAQYLVDIECKGYQDARKKPLGNMSPEEIDIWTAPVREAA
jgi:hypothetical protein